MAAVSIDQKPLERTLPIGQQVIFAVSNPTIVATKFKVKFVAEVRVNNSAGINPNTGDDLIGTFKTTPNNAGVGIFDLRPILETFVKPDNTPSPLAEYKSNTYSNHPFPIHLIDKFSLSYSSITFFQVRFLVEYADDADGSVGAPTEKVDGDRYLMFNGVLQEDDVLTTNIFGDYGYNLELFELTDNDSQFLTNAPATQYARLTDYGTFPFLNYEPTPDNRVDFVKISYYKADDSSAGTSDYIYNNISTGGYPVQGDSRTRLSYIGMFPANLQNWSANFAATVDLEYYTVQAFEGNFISNDPISKKYRINILCPNERGYEGIRLAWLNQWGAWDYYTFNMKSTRTIATNRTSYTQLGGTWNESKFKISGYKGGKKNFRVNSTEKIKLNTDFVTEEEGVWFEELINSTEVYIVNGFSSDELRTITNKYVEPVVLTTSSFVKKTIANDKLMQYTIEIEKSKMKRTQAV